jgi:Mn2+/Fe2+ NRAMP family transporter
MIVMMLLGSKPSIMGQFVIRRRLRRLGWLATAAMTIAVVAMFATL